MKDFNPEKAINRWWGKGQGDRSQCHMVLDSDFLDLSLFHLVRERLT